jgi:tripartite-type tricarboxylate transporter receptor subunit TctC
MKTVFSALVIAGSVALLAVPGISFAAAADTRYPSKSIRMIIPNGAGGSTDLVARTLAHKLSESLGQSVVTDNRGGSGGVIGTEMVARAVPDGYTLLVGTIGNLAISPHLYEKLNYDAVKDFAPVAQFSAAAYMMLVNAALPVKSVKEFVALARAKPGQLHYASAGSGTGSHLATELFLSVAAVKVTHVPYKSGAAMNTSLLSDETQLAFNGITTSLAPLKTGKARALAVTTAKRVGVAQDVPTMAESGYPAAEATSWTGVLVPAGTPRAVIARLNSEVRRALDSPEVKAVLVNGGAEPVGSTPEQFAAYIKTELVKWGKVVKATGAKAE